MRPEFGSVQLCGITNLAVLAPIKPGFVEGFESITYLERLRRLLNALNASRLAAREASAREPVFPDTIGRFGIIRNFRYAIVPPEGQRSGDPRAELADVGPWRLSLNVSFDGGWEPYMRVIYRDIGTLLDALFCNCVGYPGSRSSSFDTYCRWVRDNELSGGLFYADSAITQRDQDYLAAVEQLQRAHADPAVAERESARHAEPKQALLEARALAKARVRKQDATYESLRTLKGLYRLVPFFPPNAADEDRILLRFAHEVLEGFRTLDRQGLFTDPDLKVYPRMFRDELAWFRQDGIATPEPKATGLVPEVMQPGILPARQNHTHGCLVLLRVRREAMSSAVGFVSRYLLDEPANGIGRNLAFTYRGLLALGLTRERLDPLPREFVEGMEMRAGLLGDIGSNHPDNWVRPSANWPQESSVEVDLNTVHVVVTLRLSAPDAPEAGLHPGLAGAVQALEAPDTGLRVLSVQPMHSRRGPGGHYQVEHFGFVDGISQPKFTGPPSDDFTQPGELVFGRENGRGDPAAEPLDPLLADGSFLVVRKLRQYSERLDKVLDEHVATAPPADAARLRERALSKLMGRARTGDALVTPARAVNDNDFRFAGDTDGQCCPIHSHVRRANPRDGRSYTPRLLRRGMAYGTRAPGSDHGLVFMAYCGSLAEQFEVMQRWISGDNSSGGLSAQSDPFLGVPVPGRPRVFRCLLEDQSVLRVNLGDQPLVQLQWGLYAFAPSLRALQALPDIVAQARLQQVPPAAPPAAAADPLAEWRGRLEDPAPQRVAETWRWVREQHGGVVATPYGLLVGGARQVAEVLCDRQRRFSAAGYGERMTQSIGLGYLGLDPHEGHDILACEPPVDLNGLLRGVSARKAFADARPIVDRLIAMARVLERDEGDLPRKRPIDLVSLAEGVIAGLCGEWFGLPDAGGKLMQAGGRVSRRADDPLRREPARCPGALQSVSRYVFSPQPKDRVRTEACEQGAQVLEAVRQMLAGATPVGRLAQAIADRLKALPEVAAGDADHLVARTVAGIMLGFGPTVLGNFLRVVETWTRSRELWDLQQQLHECELDQKPPFERAQGVLKGRLLETMRQRPVPEMIWRRAAAGTGIDGKLPEDADRRVVLGLASALCDPAASDDLMFGWAGSGDPSAVHACPGRDMAIGVLLAMLSGLMEAGSLRPTGSSQLWMLIARRLPPAPVPG